jgi:hypothetical protein
MGTEGSIGDHPVAVVERGGAHSNLDITRTRTLNIHLHLDESGDSGEGVDTKSSHGGSFVVLFKRGHDLYFIVWRSCVVVQSDEHAVAEGVAIVCQPARPESLEVAVVFVFPDDADTVSAAILTGMTLAAAVIA